LSTSSGSVTVSPLRTASAHYPSGTAELRWERTGPTTWVATLAGAFVGMVELRDGAFIANNTRNATYCSYRRLAAAKRAFEAPEH